jgi:hypothetical protein
MLARAGSPSSDPISAMSGPVFMMQGYRRRRYAAIGNGSIRIEAFPRAR